MDYTFYHSNLEKRWAYEFEKLNLQAYYESESFELSTFGKKTHYKPDFYLPDLNLYVEVKGPHKYEGHGLEKTRAFAKKGNKILICNHLGKFYFAGEKTEPANLYYCDDCKKYYFFSKFDFCHCQNCSNILTLYAEGENGLPNWFNKKDNWLFDKSLYDQQLQLISDEKINSYENLYNHLQGIPETVNFTKDKISKLEDLFLKYPNQTEIKEYFFNLIKNLDFKQTKEIKFQPILLVGGPGCGKTAFATELAQILTERTPVKVEMGNGIADFSLTGSEHGWKGSAPGKIITAMFSESPKPPIKNPIIIFDELEKIKEGTRSCENIFYSILEHNSAKVFTDNFFGIPIDASGINYIATANYIEKIMSPIKNRFKIFHIRDYTEEEIEDILIPQVYKKWIDENNYIKQKFSNSLDKKIRKLIATEANYEPRKIIYALENLIEKTSIYIEEIDDSIAFLSKSQEKNFSDYIDDIDYDFDEDSLETDLFKNQDENEIKDNDEIYELAVYIKSKIKELSSKKVSL